MTTIADLQALSGIAVKENMDVVRLPLGVSRDEWEELLMSIMSRMQGKKLADGWDQKVPGILADHFKQRMLDHSIVDELASKGAFDSLVSSPAF